MKSYIALALFGLSLGVQAESEPVPKFAEETLTGDWGGTRTAWHKLGIEIELGYKGDWLHGSGGAKNASHYMWLGEAKLKLDADKLWGLSETALYFNLQTAHGGKMNTDVGSFMGVDNQEVPVSTTKFLHAWIEKGFADGKFAVLAGLYPIDSEFYVTDASGLFMHPSYGMSAEIAATAVGGNEVGTFARGPSIFNTSSFGLRFKFQPGPAYYAQLAINDGAPGHPDKNTNTHVRFNRGDGTLVIAEAGFKPSELGFFKSGDKFEGASKVAVGAWRYNPLFDNWNMDARKRNSGAYVLAEQTFGDFSVFVRHGTAAEDVNIFKSSSSIGFNFKGLIPGRDEDVFGIATTRARASEKYRQSLGTDSDTHEQVVEMTYRAQVMPWLAIQPNYQYITNPALDPALQNAKVTGVRVEVAF